jgi:hypothetical protein
MWYNFKIQTYFKLQIQYKWELTMNNLMNHKYMVFCQYWFLMDKIKLFFFIFQVSNSIPHIYIPNNKSIANTNKESNQTKTSHTMFYFLDSVP